METESSSDARVRPVEAGRWCASCDVAGGVRGCAACVRADGRPGGSLLTRRGCAVPECDRAANVRKRGRWCGPHSANRPIQPGDKPCASRYCDRAATANGVCSGHHNIYRAGGDIHRPLKAPTATKRGQWAVDKRGYVYQNTIPAAGEKSRIVVQHRVVMAQMLGRELTASEEVHHKNGVRSDNRPENLELWSTSQPAGQRVVDKVLWAKEILRLYSPQDLRETEA